jgi:hypothetical protein
VKEEVNMRTLLFSALFSAGLAIGASAANAAPAGGLAVSDAAAQTDTHTLVRDGCGRGRHVSKWRGVCVWNGTRGYYYAPRAYGYYGYGPGYYYAPPVVYGSPYGFYGYRRYWW